MNRTHAEIIALWPSLEALADDTGQQLEAVRHWAKRNRIPKWHWSTVASSAKRRRFGVTEAELALGMLRVNGR